MTMEDVIDSVHKSVVRPDFLNDYRDGWGSCKRDHPYLEGPLKASYFCATDLRAEKGL